MHSFNVLPGCLPERLSVLVPTSAAYENAPFLWALASTGYYGITESPFWFCKKKYLGVVLIWNFKKEQLSWPFFHLLLGCLCFSFLICPLCVCMCVCAFCDPDVWLLGILVPWPGIEPGPLAVKRQSSDHWTAREFPACCVLINFFQFLKIRT